jgi:hypothetical protein
MNAFSSRLSLMFLGLITLYMVMQTAQAAPEMYQQSISSPYYNGYPLDHCFYAGKRCGKYAADKYCRDRGFFTALSFKEAKSSDPTKYMSTGRLCHGTSCQTFSSIVCQGEKKLSNPIYIPSENRNTVLFQRPNYLADRVDSCTGLDVNCSWRTADHYCQMHGYQKSTAMKRWSHAGPTRTLGSTQACSTRDKCHAYKWIRCERYPTG